MLLYGKLAEYSGDNMDKMFKVAGFYKTSIGTIVVVKLPHRDIFLNHGAILNNEGRSRWKIIAVGMGKKPDLEDPESDWILFRDYKIEHIDGDKLLKEGDLLYVE
jgi:hypothetical protein